MAHPAKDTEIVKARQEIFQREERPTRSELLTPYETYLRPRWYEAGNMRAPDTPGLGVRLDREKVNRYAKLYRESGGYFYDRDPGRPGWYSLMPNQHRAAPRGEPPPCNGQ